MSDPVVLTSLDMVTHEWLTGVLTKSGALSKGHVVGFEADSQTHNYSTGHRIRIAYSADAQGTRPTRLFLKLVNADMGDELFGASEVDYYRRDYAGVIRAPIILCYDAAYSEKLLRYHLLLDDLTDSWGAAIEVVTETDAELARAMITRQTDRVRYAAPERVPLEIRRAAAEVLQYVADTPPVAQGRVELLWYFQEQSVSVLYHRYGNLGLRSGEPRTEPL